MPAYDDDISKRFYVVFKIFFQFSNFLIFLSYLVCVPVAVSRRTTSVGIGLKSTTKTLLR